VGFRVRSKRGTQFRRWANAQLQEFIVKGFVMDDERLKNPPVEGASVVPDYFDELLERIRDIRASERRMYLRVREIFKLSADTSRRQKKPRRSSASFRTNCISQRRGRWPPSSSTVERTHPNPTWG